MLGKYTSEIAIGGMNWEKAARVTKDLVEEGYAVMTTLEEQLIIINYAYAVTESQADRNNMAFMSREEYEENLFGDGEE